VLTEQRGPGRTAVLGEHPTGRLQRLHVYPVCRDGCRRRRMPCHHHILSERLPWGAEGNGEWKNSRRTAADPEDAATSATQIANVGSLDVSLT
jgi:hypothetical protein